MKQIELNIVIKYYYYYYDYANRTKEYNQIKSFKA